MNTDDDTAPGSAGALDRFYRAHGQAGRDARAALREAFRAEDKLCVILKIAESGHVAIFSGKKLIKQFNLKRLRRTMRPKDFALVELLLDLLHQQSTTATVAGVLASAELALQEKRLQGAPKGGRAVARKERTVVKNRIKAELRHGRDPRKLFADWSDEYGYSRRHLYNLLMQVREEMS